MGICIYRNEDGLETICDKQPQFQIDQNKSKLNSIVIWRITQTGTQPLKWPFTFYSSSSYIIIVAKRSNMDHPILQKNRTSIQFAQMLFRAQFLCQHLKISKKLMLNNKQYSLNIYSFYGDSLDDEILTKSQLTYYIQKLTSYLQLGAGSLCLSMLNQSQQIPLKNDLKEYVDFQSQQYTQSNTQIFFQQQLFANKPSIKQSIHQSQKNLIYQNFTYGSNMVPYIQIKQSKQKKKNPNEKQHQNSFPFICQITQINIKSNNKFSPKLQAGNYDSSNHIFDQFINNSQYDEIQKIQQFLKGLYLSTQKISKNYNILNINKIKLIVNCSASTCKNWFVNDFSYKWIDMPDPLDTNSNQYNIDCLIYQVADLAGKCLAQPAGVLLHCSGYNPKIQYSGSRSAAILIGIIMSSLKLTYENSLAMLNSKWPIKLPEFMQKQLKNLQKRKKEKPKGFYIYSICSYSKSYPRHLVAIYICEVENIQNIQGIDSYQKYLFLCIGPNGNKIMVGRQCQFKDQYQKYAKQHLRLLNKYQGINIQCTTQTIEKTFRKQPKIEHKQKILYLDPKIPNKSAGFLRNQQMVLKYPILRPIWQKKKDDGFYFTIKQKNQGAQIMMNKGMHWIGYQSDKQQFFDRIINCYLGHIPHNKIYIIQSQQQKSLFDMSKLD